MLPGNTIDIPPELIAGWDGYYSAVVAQALAANPAAAAQLIRTSGAAVDRRDLLNTTGQTTLGLLWYNVFATEDGQAQLNGNPFDNLMRAYRGSLNDAALNAGVSRQRGSLRSGASHRTTRPARSLRPLVTLHTTGDEIIPYWHQKLYRQKLLANGVTGVLQIPVNRYGHCNFTTEEVLGAFSLLVIQATGALTIEIPASIWPASGSSWTRHARKLTCRN